MIGLLAIFASRDPSSRWTMDRDLLSRIMQPAIWKWGLDQDMELLARVIRERKTVWSDGLDLEFASNAVIRAKNRGDIRATLKAVQEYDEAKWRAWLSTSGGQKYATLFEQSEKRVQGVGTKDKRPRPDLEEGITVARSVLPGIADKGWLNNDWERGFLPEVRASCWLPPIGNCNLYTLQKYIDGATTSSVDVETLLLIRKKLLDRRQLLPRPLSKWWHEYERGGHRYPNEKAAPPQRPNRLSYLWRNILIQTTIELLDRVGMRPNATATDPETGVRRASGCEAVALALQDLGMTPTRADGDPFFNVQRIWKLRPWHKPIFPDVKKYSRFTIQRFGR